MNEIIVTEFVTLDGVMEAPGGEPTHPHSGWVFPYHDDGTLEFKGKELEGVTDQLLGRVTYQGFSAAWPERKDDTGFADKMNAMPKHVVSSTLSEGDLEWNNSALINGNADVTAQIEELKSSASGPILVAGSRTLVHYLLDQDLVDELRAMIFPIILGSGDRLWPDRDQPIKLALADSQSFESGVVVSTYRRP